MLDLDYRTILENRLKELLITEEKAITEAALYAVIAPSKRIRPMMLLSIAGMDGLDAACAIEMIHTYSLIHDDLPAMDDDDMRRNQPSLHIKTDEATAILTGDFLLSYAFEILADYPETIKIVAQKIGASGIIGGQIRDLLAKEKAVSYDEYLQIAKKKTGALFQAACLAGAIIAQLTDSEIVALECFGALFGEIFQIKDDLNDKVELSSFQAIVGLERAEEILDHLKNEANLALDSLRSPPGYLRALLK